MRKVMFVMIVLDGRLTNVPLFSYNRATADY
jgi:hypothetical protein